MSKILVFTCFTQLQVISFSTTWRVKCFSFAIYSISVKCKFLDLASSSVNKPEFVLVMEANKSLIDVSTGWATSWYHSIRVMMWSSSLGFSLCHQWEMASSKSAIAKLLENMEMAERFWDQLTCRWLLYSYRRSKTLSSCKREFRHLNI